jgi:TRAP transporter TAXI family solute receptor
MSRILLTVPRILMLGLLLLLAACSQGPDAQTVQDDLNQRLQEALGPDSVSIIDLKRQGSAPGGKAADGAERRVVYFDATLELNQDRDFANWEAPGVASLVSLFGAGPRGLSGIESGGNQAGDQLLVHGSLIYQLTPEGWQLQVPLGFSAESPPKSVAGSGDVAREQLILAIGTALNLKPERVGEIDRRIIDEETARTLSSIKGRIARSKNGYALASGPESGQYFRLARAMAKLAKEQDILVQPLVTEGGIENLSLLRSNQATMALTQSDVAWQALRGSGAFTGQAPYGAMRVLANLYPEPVHVLVSADGPQKIADLRGKRINLGQPGSASRDTAFAVLSAHGLQTEDFAEVTSLDLQSALDALRDGKIDALVQVIGLPADAIRNASEKTPLRLLPLDPEAIGFLEKNRQGTFAFSIPRGSYPQQGSSIPTLAVSSLLVSDTAISAGEAERLVHELFQPHLAWLQLGSIQGTQLSRAKALQVYGLPLHDGVSEAVEEQ